MRRERRDFERAGHDRWLVSYADFVTLLFALFVVLFASSQVDRRNVGEAVRRAFDGSERPKTTSVLGGTVDNVGQGNRMMRGPGGANIYVPVPRALESAELLPSRELLDRELSDEIVAGRLTIHMEARGMVVSLREASYFVSGADQLSPDLYPVLAKLAAAVLQTSNPIRLEGHTDSIPIHNARFRSNWDLSAGRAIAMMDALRTQFEVPASRMAVAGYADNFPVDTNDTPEGRARNRRVDLVILSQSGLVSLPDSVQSKSATPSAPAPAGLRQAVAPATPGTASPGATPSR
jgi:chemotaxis protein MotB